MVLPRVSYADDTLTLDLPPSQRALEARAAIKAQQAQQAQQATEFSQHSSSSQDRTSKRVVHIVGESGAVRGNFPSRQGGTERVVGRLGEVQVRTSITRGSSVLATVSQGTYIAINEESTRSYGVLMADGTTGWIARRYVHILDYQVVSPNAGAVPDFGNQSLAARTGAEFFGGDPQSLLREAYRYLGVPYQWGGNTASGIDCSGFIKKIFAANGYPLPRTAAEQMNVGLPVSPAELQCGDRLYFGHGSRITHTGLYIGNGYFIHSSAGQHGVAISRLTDQPYQRIFNGARR